MKIKNIWMFVLIVAVVAAACGGGASDDAGLNSAEGLMKALQGEGATVAESDPIEQPFFSVVGQGILVNGEALQVFEYADADAAAAEADTIAPDGGSVGTSMMMWIDAPHFFQQNNLIVLYVGSNGDTLNVLEAVLGPQIAGR